MSGAVRLRCKGGMTGWGGVAACEGEEEEEEEEEEGDKK
jgi:hypothetical protein